MAKQISLDTEDRIRAAWNRGDHRGGATLAIETYGPEILGFLSAILNDDGNADDVFSVFCEDVWRGLPGFEWRCSVRGWCYTLARHAAMRFLRTANDRAARHVPLSRVPEVAQLAERVRTATAPAHRRSEVKSRIRHLREQLPVDEQVLLILRIDKDLPWTDVAMVLAEGEPLAGETLTRKSATVRKRFQYVKEKLRRMAREAGLL